MARHEITASDVAREIRKLREIVRRDPNNPLKQAVDAVPDDYEPEGTAPEPIDETR